MKRFMFAAALIASGAYLCSGPAAAAQNMQGQKMQQSAPPAAAAQSSDGSISYVTGGVGDDGMEAMKAQASNYDLQMMFVGKSNGEYLADVDVAVTDGSGHNVFETKTQGPMLLAQVPPGHYKVTARTEDGKELTQRVNVTAKHRAEYVLRYPTSI